MQGRNTAESSFREGANDSDKKNTSRTSKILEVRDISCIQGNMLSCFSSLSSSFRMAPGAGMARHR